MTESTITVLTVLAMSFVVVIGALVAGLAVVFVRDVAQRRDAIRRNYPVIGRFRYLFQTLGGFFRQYFFALDRQELPFNRAERNWVYDTARDADNTAAFGSTKQLTPEGTAVFVNCPFPTLERDAAQSRPLEIGPHARRPYRAGSFVNVSGMSWGSLSTPAVRALSGGARRAGCWLNTGEGGLSPHHLEGGCDLVFQMGTAKYGVRRADGGLDEDRLAELGATPQVRMIEIKLSQGAKPGKGGLLPAEKITPEIARVRGIPEDRDSVAPNRHPEVDSVPELLDFVDRVRSVSGLPTGFKVVIGAYGWLDALCREVNRRGPEAAPDFITVDSADGGTGAAPMSLMDNLGLPIEESLPMVCDILERHGLKGRVRVIASGKLLLPSAVAWALCAGADFVNIGRGFMFSIGCIQAMRCNRNTCPTGVTTHDPRRQAALDPADKSVKAATYCINLRREVETIAHACGVHEPRDLRRYHLRVMRQGRSVPMDELHPYPDVPARDPTRARPA